jgi:hypothetical protein
MCNHVATHTDALILVNEVQQRVTGCRKINKLRMGKVSAEVGRERESCNWSRDLKIDRLMSPASA